MKITTGELEVLNSGLVRNGFSNSIKFDFDSLWVEFHFIIDGSGSRNDYQASDDLKGLKINVYNSNSPLGAGLFKPIKIGSLEGRELWLAYASYKPFDEHDTWVLEYVFYKGGRVDE
jgi:hypothetical protein